MSYAVRKQSLQGKTWWWPASAAGSPPPSRARAVKGRCAGVCIVMGQHPLSALARARWVKLDKPPQPRRCHRAIEADGR